MFSNDGCANLCRSNTLCVGGGATAKLQQTTVPVFTLMLEKSLRGSGRCGMCDAQVVDDAAEGPTNV